MKQDIRQVKGYSPLVLKQAIEQYFKEHSDEFKAVQSDAATKAGGEENLNSALIAYSTMEYFNTNAEAYRDVLSRAANITLSQNQDLAGAPADEEFEIAVAGGAMPVVTFVPDSFDTTDTNLPSDSTPQQPAVVEAEQKAIDNLNALTQTFNDAGQPQNADTVQGIVNALQVNETNQPANSISVDPATNLRGVIEKYSFVPQKGNTFFVDLTPTVDVNRVLGDANAVPAQVSNFVIRDGGVTTEASNQSLTNFNVDALLGADYKVVYLGLDNIRYTPEDTTLSETREKIFIDSTHSITLSRAKLFGENPGSYLETRLDISEGLVDGIDGPISFTSISGQAPTFMPPELADQLDSNQLVELVGQTLDGLTRGIQSVMAQGGDFLHSS